MGFIEVDKPEDFFDIGFTSGKMPANLNGIICPIPKEWLCDQFSLAKYSKAIRSDPRFCISKGKGLTDNDVTKRVYIHRGREEKWDEVEEREEKSLPPELVEMKRSLITAFEKTIGRAAYSAIYQIDSNNHRFPLSHAPTGIINLKGPTAIMFLRNAEGGFAGKKSLPPRSMAIFLGDHAAPDTWLPRLNILCF